MRNSADVKKEQVLRLLNTGMDRYKAMLLAECTDEEIAYLEKDETFQVKMDMQELIRERDYLDKMNQLIEFNLNRGISTELRFMLGKTNPERWGAMRDAPKMPAGPMPVTIIPASSEESEDGE